jgi:predicted TIM-barrel fold metal-dependent hydrolase
VRNHPVYFHAELTEKALPYAISEIGDDRFLYASDYPHEPVDEIEEGLEHFLLREDLSQESKQKILCDNINAIYAMG